MTRPPVSPPDVASAFAQFPTEHRLRLEQVRAQIFEQAEALEAGPLTETLKWGQPAYLNTDRKTGTTLRLGVLGDAAAVFVHCQTTLIAEFQSQGVMPFEFDGTRALVLRSDTSHDAGALNAFLAQALTYHRKKNANG